jgi:hypothetical protein
MMVAVVAMVGVVVVLMVPRMAEAIRLMVLARAPALAGAPAPAAVAAGTAMAMAMEEVDLAGSMTDEQVKIEKYCSGLQHDLRELCRTSPMGARWANLADLVQYATLQWPVIQERIFRRKKQSSGVTNKIAGKRKASNDGASGSRRSASKAKLGASGTPLTDEQKIRDFELKLCHKCHQLGHQMKRCPLHNKKGGKVAIASGSAPQEDNIFEEDF